MAVYNLAQGGGRIKGIDFCSTFYPQNLPVCCDDGNPDLQHNARRNQYFRALNFSGEKALTCWEDADKVVAGDKLVLFPIHAGKAVREIAIDNIHGCEGLQYHLEVLDLYELMKDPAAPALFTLPTVDGSAASFSWESVDGGNLVYGDPYGVADPVAPAVVGEACRKHLVVALVLDSLPTGQNATTGQCVPCETRRLGCAGGNQLSCINVEVTAPVEVAGGLRQF